MCVKEVSPPPSLRNILRELTDDVGPATLHGLPISTKPHPCCDLTPWTRQGVLLLNTALTVREGEAGSHCDIWQPFTDEVIRAVCDSATVAPHFILWVRRRRALERCCGKLQLWGQRLRVDGVSTPIDPQGVCITGNNQRSHHRHLQHPPVTTIGQ